MADSIIKVPLHIINPSSENTLIQVNVPYSDKRVEVTVPNNVQVGHQIRLKGLVNWFNQPGDLIVEISKITICGNNDFKETKQKMITVTQNNFSEVNRLLEIGWKVREFKPFKDSSIVYVYVLLEKETE